MYIAKFKNGTVFTEKQGTWDDCPLAEIVRLEITLPVLLQNIMPDGTIEKRPSPTVSLEGYDKYYFANIARATILKSSDGKNFATGDLVNEIIGKTIVGIDEERDFALQIIVWKNSNVDTKRHKFSDWKKREGIRETAIHKGRIK